MSAPSETILLVEDNSTNLQILHTTLSGSGKGYRLLVAKQGEDAIEIAQKARPELILLDILMPPGIDGYETCRRLKASEDTKGIAVIFLSSLDEVQDKVTGFEVGAVDFVTKPFQAEEILARVETHLTVQRLQREVEERNRRLQHELRVAQDLAKEASARVEGPLLGESSAVRLLREGVTKHAETEAAVFLVGPPGGGQEAVARAIHQSSSRGSHAFIYLNCASLQSETQVLFGTGDNVSGKFQLADRGTLFLDGVDRLHPEDQQELLSALESEEDSSNGRARLIASNSRDLTGSDPGGGGLDPDLAKYLGRNQLRIPSLAERREDIAELASHFLRHEAARQGKPVEGVAAESLQRLEEYSWPGNVRELRSVIEKALVTCNDSELKIDEALLDEGISIGSYNLAEKLGEGGMGEVWRGNHRLLRRQAAIKLIKEDQLSGSAEDAAFLARFRREAGATAELQSPHTVSLFDFGISDEGDLYYVMELLVGMDLQQLVSQYGTLPPHRAIWFLEAACRSLGEAHDLGMVHRDIKPANLFSARLGREYDFLKVLDFGMVTGHRAEDITLTNPGAATGTPAFMAPELAMGQPVDGRADVYALGCVGFFLITGQLVFEGTNAMQVAMAHVQTEPPVPSSLSEEDVPPALDDILLACLTKAPADRPTIDELEKRLGAIELPQRWSGEAAKSWWKSHGPKID